MTQPADATEALLREVRLHVFGKAADTGRVPQPPEIAAALGRSQAEVEEALRRLAAGKVLILAPNDGNIWANDCRDKQHDRNCTISQQGNREMADDLKRVVVWNNLLIDGRDYCGLWHTAEGWLLKGTVVGVLKDQRPLLASYEIQCDENWLTHRVQVDRTLGNDAKTLSLSVEKRVWRSSAQELP